MFGDPFVSSNYCQPSRISRKYLKMEFKNEAQKKSIFIILFLLTASFANGEEFHDFGKDSQLEDLSSPIRCFFDAAAQNDGKALGPNHRR